MSVSSSTPKYAASLLGYLIHAVQVLPDGKIFCDHLIRFVAGWRPPSLVRHHISTGLRTDLTWHDILNSWCGRRILPTFDWEDLGFFTDASGGLGAGGLLGDRWWCLRWSTAYRGVSNDSVDIFWKEMFAIWISLALWGPSPHHSPLRQPVLCRFSCLRPRPTSSRKRIHSSYRNTTVLDRVPLHLRARLHSVLSQRTLTKTGFSFDRPPSMPLGSWLAEASKSHDTIKGYLLMP